MGPFFLFHSHMVQRDGHSNVTFVHIFVPYFSTLYICGGKDISSPIFSPSTRSI